jgi:hypothetical protein
MAESTDAYAEKSGLEIAMAQMETRLREMITELMEPTISRTTLAVAQLEDVKMAGEAHARTISELQLGQFQAMEQVATILSFKEEMGRWDAQRRQHESSLDEKQEAMQQKLDSYQFNLEQKESALHHLNRNVTRLAEELKHITEESEIQKDATEERLDDISLKVASSRGELEAKIVSLELKHSNLTDELWGEETGLAKVAGELKKTNLAFKGLQEAVSRLQAEKAEAVALEKLRSEVASMVSEANSAVTAMGLSVGNVVNDVREHFRTASQTIAAHNATFISEVRSQYQEELAQAARIRDEVQEFVGQTGKSIASLDARVAEAAAKAGSLAAEAREELEELNRRRKRDKTSSDNELKALKRRLGGVFDNSDMVLRGIEHIYSVLNTVLQGELMQCSLERQDSVDRKRIALIGAKDDESVLARSCQTEPQRARPECRGKAATAYPSTASRPQGAAPAAGRAAGDRPVKTHDPVVRVDNRCLSCSGQAPMVLSAFKMACLQYTPSPVDHEGERHERDALLVQRHALLQSAQASLLGGPDAMRTGGARGVLGSTQDLDDEAALRDSSVSPQKDAAKESWSKGNDAFSAYAAMEAKLSSSQKGNNAGSTFRLPNLSAAAGGAGAHGGLGNTAPAGRMALTAR